MAATGITDQLVEFAGTVPDRDARTVRAVRRRAGRARSDATAARADLARLAALMG
ncbi:hypothetical protein [Pseudosulfitobacter koreensis]|uniref:Uncharacterized protein n=1 Tax=Pseudosulfitobacter koreensis TaxID=2968472 RepID=A0ABT1Z272_9RHOB|nr:hypothetical protein [Pseudosulfitobacter koreense]MCR8827247.1 hypothetical protein [Pseudosulfitobacter koreense]